MEGNEKIEKSLTPPPRRDKGQIRLNARDLSLLTWVGDQYAVRLDSLQLLLGREARQPTREAGRLRPSTARRVISRWLQDELVTSRKFFYGEPSWIWLTQRGLRQMAFSFRLWTPKVALLRHVHEVNRVRMHIEQSYASLQHWRGERRLRREHCGDKDFHVPDGEVVTQAHGVIAVEVELSLKARPRLQQIVKTLAHHYPRVWVFVTPVTRTLVAEMTGPYSGQFRLYDLHKVAA